MDCFDVMILKKKTIALREDPRYFIVKSKEKGMTIDISEELFDMKAQNNQCVSVLKPYLCLLVCLTNRTSLDLKRLLSLLFSPKLGLPKVAAYT